MAKFDLPHDHDEILDFIRDEWSSFQNSAGGASGSGGVDLIEPGEEIFTPHGTVEAGGWAFEAECTRSEGQDNDGNEIFESYTCSGSGDTIRKAAQDFLENLELL